MAASRADTTAAEVALLDAEERLLAEHAAFALAVRSARRSGAIRKEATTALWERKLGAAVALARVLEPSAEPWAACEEELRQTHLQHGRDTHEFLNDLDAARDDAADACEEAERAREAAYAAHAARVEEARENAEAKLEKLAQEHDDLLAVLETDNRLEAVRDALALHKAEELLAFFADSQEDESAPLEHPSVDRRFPPKRRRPADA